jgi:hypothetical protein
MFLSSCILRYCIVLFPVLLECRVANGVFDNDVGKEALIHLECFATIHVIIIVIVIAHVVTVLLKLIGCIALTLRERVCAMRQIIVLSLNHLISYRCHSCIVHSLHYYCKCFNNLYHTPLSAVTFHILSVHKLLEGLAHVILISISIR